MTSPGTILRRARSQQGLDLTEVATRIKVNRKYLEAMEADDWKSLPGGFFYKSFVRQYAEALGLDADEIEEALAAIQIEEAPLPAPLPRRESSMLRDIPRMGGHGSWLAAMRVLPSIGVLLAVLIGCSVLYSWWRRMESQARTNETSAAARSSSRRGRREPAPVAETRPVPPQVSTVTEPSQAAAAQPAPTGQPPVQGSPQPAPAAATDGVRITLAATEDTWVSVSADGRNVFAGVIKGQESRNVEGKLNTRVLIGNAGGLQIEWNGRQLGSLGKKGEVRDVLFTRDSYKLIQKAPPADEDAKPAQSGEATT
jgi:cytoskeletal protein RodZ